jgi:hypothetical protein
VMVGVVLKFSLIGSFISRFWKISNLFFLYAGSF